MAACSARPVVAAAAALALAALVAACAAAPPRPAAPDQTGRLYAGRPTATFGTQLPVASAAEAGARAADASAKGDPDLALYFLVKAVELDPQDTDALLVIGKVHESRNNLAQARYAYELGRGRDPLRRELSERLGLVYVQLGLDREARALLEPLAAEDDAGWQVHDALGILADRDGRHGAAQLEYSAALARAPQSAATLNNRGYSRLLAGDLDGAERDFEAALALGPFGRAWTNLGSVQAQRGRYADALSSFRHALPNAEALNRVGESALARQDYAVARDLLLQAAAASPTWFERAHANLAAAEAHLTLPPAQR